MFEIEKSPEALRLTDSFSICNLTKGVAETNYVFETLLILLEIELKILANDKVHIVNLSGEVGLRGFEIG